MWTQIGVDDQTGLEQFIRIMRQMDRRYAGLTPEDLRMSIDRRRAAIFLYRAVDFEIALHFEYSSHLQYATEQPHYRIESLGFIGNVTPAAALDLIVEKANDFAVGQGMASLYAVRPKVMDYAPLTALHNLVPAHPKLNVTLHRETAALVVWEIVYVAVPANT